MKYKLLGLSIAIITLAAGAAIFQPAISTSAAGKGVLALPLPTPKTKVKVTPKAVEPTLSDAEFDGVEIIKTDAEWKKQLTPAAFNVMRQEGTEAPYSGALTKNHKHGTYYCAACHLALFRSIGKFESGTGWPSFFEPIYKKNVVEKVDKTLGEERTEVECARCHAHLGHVFDDGPKPTGLRYCMNSVAMTFKPGK